jgi:spermidine synthase
VRRLLVLFFLSGISGLVYEVVWLRMLIRAFGVTVYAVSTVLVAFMGGLALGSWAAARYLRGSKSLLRLYALAEVAIGISALASTALMAVLPDVYRAVVMAEGGDAIGVTLIRAVLALVVLLPPTILMGTTLPLVSGFLARREGEVARHVGLLYGANTLGAVVGTLGSGLVGIAVLGERATVIVAAIINLSVGAMAWILVRRSGPQTDGDPSNVSVSPAGPRLDRAILFAAAISGFCALAYQVVWTRQLNLLLGNSVYAFSLMLGSYLAGIGIGSVLVARVAASSKRPLFLFAMMELLVSFLALASLHLILEIGLRDTDNRYTYSQIWSFGDFLRLAGYSALIVVPLALLLGAIFPVATRIVSEGRAHAEEAVGKLYAYNTFGAILGSGITGFFLIPLLGTLMTFLIASAISFGVGAWVLSLSRRVEPSRSKSAVLALSLGAAFALLLATSFRDPMLAILEARVAPAEKLLAHVEGKGASVTMFRNTKSGRDLLYVNGLFVSNTSDAMGQLLIDMPLAFHPDPKKSLIIGLGAGEAFRSSVQYGLETTVVDLLPDVVGLFRRFRTDPERYLDNPKSHVVINDGRNYLLATDERFDLIVVDGFPPVFASGMVNLYSYEFAQIAAQHLTPEGIFLVFFPLVCFEDDLWNVARNFADTFPSIQLVASSPERSFAILLGSPSKDTAKFGIETADLAKRLAARGLPEPEVAAANLKRGLVLGGDDLRKKASLYPRVTDDDPLTEFPLGRFMRNEKYLSDARFIYAYVRSLAENAAPRAPEIDR